MSEFLRPVVLWALVVVGPSLPPLMAHPVPTSWNAAQNRAEQIMREAYRRFRTESQTNDGSLEVVDRKGKVFKKAWKFWRKGYAGASKTLLRFTAPPEVEGVGLLVYNHVDSSDEQWMYIPAIRRDRRVAPQDKNVRFMGTDFTHEDMEQRDVEELEYEMTGEETFEGLPCYKIRGWPRRSQDSQYSQFYFWVRKDIYVTLFTELYVEGKLRRTLAFRDVQETQGVWTPMTIEMRDVVRGSHTTIRTSNLKYYVDLADEIFTLRNLRRFP